jgi:nucleotide-binding universal stress UspA family protein
MHILILTGEFMNIIWTYNPFQQNDKLNLLGKEILTHYFGKSDSAEAVYIASNAEVELTTAFNIDEGLRFSLYPKGIIKKQLKELAFSKLKLTVLPLRSISLTVAVNELVNYAKKSKTDLIVLPTNNKKTLPAFVLGSFAETLTHLSSSHLLIYHQKTRFISQAPKKILYAHDFSEKGKAGLLESIIFAKKWNAILTVVHIKYKSSDITDEEFEINLDRQTKKIVQLLTKENVKHSIVTINDQGPVDQLILQAAKKEKTDLIAITAQSNKLQVLLGGSVSRKVLRGANIPILVLKVK